MEFSKVCVFQRLIARLFSKEIVDETKLGTLVTDTVYWLAAENNVAILINMRAIV